MVEVDFSGEYLNASNAKQDEIVTITNEGKYELRKVGTDEKMMLDLGVEINTKAKTYSPFDKEGQILVNAWGSDTLNWVGKQFSIIIVNYTGFGGVTKQKIQPVPILD